MVVALPRLAGSSLSGQCRLDRRGLARSCAVRAASPRAAVALARRNLADFVVVRLASLNQLRFLQGVQARTHILALVPGPAVRFDQKAWSRAVELAAKDPSLDLVVSVGSARQPKLAGYLALVHAARTKNTKTIAAIADSSPPSTPGAISVNGASGGSISLRWGASEDDLALAGYRVYRDSLLAGTTTSTQLTIADLSCGNSYSFTVEAFDTAGNHSARTNNATAATSPCTSTSTQHQQQQQRWW